MGCTSKAEVNKRERNVCHVEHQNMVQTDLIASEQSTFGFVWVRWSKAVLVIPFVELRWHGTDDRNAMCGQVHLFSGELPSGHYRHKPPSTRLFGRDEKTCPCWVRSELRLMRLMASWLPGHFCHEEHVCSSFRSPNKNRSRLTTSIKMFLIASCF